MENICLTHQSMHEALLHTLTSSEFRDVPQLFGADQGAISAPLPRQAPHLTREEAEHLCETLGLSLPIHTLVANRSLRRHSDILVSHIWDGGLLDCTFTRLSRGIQAIPPELYFLQHAADHALVDNIALGYDLCGNYLRRPGFDTLYDQPQLLTTERLEAFSSCCAHIRGAKKLRDALPYIADSSRSPQESYLAIRLALPGRHGGEGIGKPIMNYRVNLTHEAARALEQKYCLCDLYYPESRLDIEYNGDDFHRDPSKDLARKLALNSMGIEVIFVTQDQLTDQNKYDLLIQSIAKKAGVRPRPRSKDHFAQKVQLWDYLKQR